jgi:hypothetical protein
MPARNRHVQVRLALRTRDFAVFAEAAVLLRRVLGNKSPTTLKIIARTLRHREPLGVADDYLDAIAWPMERRRALRQSKLTRKRDLFWGRDSGAPADLSRN